MKQRLNTTSITKLIAAFFVLAITFSCSDDDSEILNLGNLEVQLELAEGLGDISLENVPVLITHTVDNSTAELITDASGLVSFTDIAVGTYSIIITSSIDDLTLSGTANDVLVAQQETTSETVVVNATNSDGGLVLKEIYTAGSGYITLFKDSFVEIFNNSSETLYADGMYIANVFGSSGSTGDVPVSTDLDISENIYTDVMSQIPGAGTDYPIEPGKSIVIALNAINFQEGSSNPDGELDNTDATLEHYSIDWLEAQGITGNTYFDLDNPSVPNMTPIYMFENTNFFRLSVATATVALISSEASFSDSGIVDYTATGSTSTYKVMSIPVDMVIDGVDILNNSSAAEFKRMPSDIDAGFTYVNPDGAITYTGLSSRRKIDEDATSRFGRTILMDTNNSTVDFESIDFPDKYGYNN